MLSYGTSHGLAPSGCQAIACACYYKAIIIIIPTSVWGRMSAYFDGLVQGCSSSSADALELPQSCTKPLMIFSGIVIPIICMSNVCACVCVNVVRVFV